jgi:hypothetical protein
MDAISDYLIRFLETMARSHRMLNRLVILLKHRPEVIDAALTLECRKEPHNPFPFLEQFVEARMRDGKVLTWSLDLILEEERWWIDYDVSESGKDGQSDIVGFPDRTATTLDELAQELEAATSELVESASSLDFGSYAEGSSTDRSV